MGWKTVSLYHDIIIEATYLHSKIDGNASNVSRFCRFVLSIQPGCNFLNIIGGNPSTFIIKIGLWCLLLLRRLLLLLLLLLCSSIDILYTIYIERGGEIYSTVIDE